MDRFWPDKQELQDVCNILGEQLSTSALLAVHQPMEFLIKKYNQLSTTDETKLESIDQDKLLENFLSDDALQNKFCFRVIQGSSGSGKSHYINWVKAQLERKKSTAHIVWIRKHDSLRVIFKKLFEPFATHPDFKSLINEIDIAHSRISGENAGLAFKNGLEFALKEYKRVQDEFRAEKSVSLNETQDEGKQKKIKEEIQALNHLMYYTDNLFRLINELAEDLIKENGPFSRIITRSLEGRTKLENEEKERFKVEDIKETLDLNATSLSQPLNIFYTRLDSAGNEGYEKAIEILNDPQVTDQAISHAFRINNMVSGGRTFQDIFTDIRKLLFKESRELIFLVEDFTLLSGIQKELLPFFTQDIEQGSDCCVVRSMIAVTPGWFTGPLTSNLQRSDGVREISDKVDNEMDAFQRVSQLVGKYLNAARWGKEALDLKLERIGDGNLSENWMGNFIEDKASEEEKNTLARFGNSSEGYNLFPYNQSAINSMTKRFLSVGDRLQFIARPVINDMLLELLVKGREDFLNQRYPSEEFGKWDNLNAEMLEKISNIDGINEIEKIKLQKLICHWSENKNTIDEIKKHLPDEVMEVFGLNAINEYFGADTFANGPVQQTNSVTETPVVSIRPPTPTGNVELNLPVGTDPPSRIEPNNPFTFDKSLLSSNDRQDFERAVELERQLTEWGKKKDTAETKEILGFAEANYIRRIIAEFLDEQYREKFLVNRDVLTLLKKGDLFYLPDARGNPRTKRVELINDDEDRVQLTLDLKSMVRYKTFLLFKEAQKYKDLRQDENRIQNFLDQLSIKIENFFEDDENKRLENLKIVIERQAYIIGVKNIEGISDQYNFAHLIQEMEFQDRSDEIGEIANQSIRNWANFRNEVWENFQKGQEELCKFLFVNPSERKGLRITKLMDIKEKEDFDNFDTNISTSLLSKLKKRALIKQSTNIKNTFSKIFKILPEYLETVDQSDELSFLQRVEKLFHESMVIPSFTETDSNREQNLKLGAKKIEDINIEEIYRKLKLFDFDNEECDLNELCLIGQIDPFEIDFLASAIDYLNKYLDDLESNLKNYMRTLGVEDNRDYVQKIENDLDVISNNLRALEES